MLFGKVLFAISLGATSLALPGPGEIASLKRNDVSTTCVNVYNGQVACCNTPSNNQNLLQTLGATLSGLLDLPIISTLSAGVTCTTVSVIGGLSGTECGTNVAVCCVPENNAQLTQSGLINIDLLNGLALNVCPVIKAGS